VKRLFWLGVGAAAGYYAAKRGDEALERARERGLVGNVTLAAATAQKAAATATRTAAALGEKARAAADAQTAPAPTAEPTPAPRTSPTPSSPSTSREVRP
jgi:septal ring-binding cell division protein DamX